MHIQKLVLLIGLNHWIDVFCLKNVLLTEILNISEIVKRLNGLLPYLHTQITNWHSIHTIDYHAANGPVYTNPSICKTIRPDITQCLKFFKINKLPLENVFHFLDQFMFQNSNYQFMFINLVWINLTSKKLALKGPPNAPWWGIQKYKSCVLEYSIVHLVTVFGSNKWMDVLQQSLQYYSGCGLYTCPDYSNPIRGKRFSSQRKFWLSIFFQFSRSTQGHWQ